VRDGRGLVADYLAAFWDEPCYDAWEEGRTQHHTSTLASAAAGLRAAGGLLGGGYAARAPRRAWRSCASAASRTGTSSRRRATRRSTPRSCGSRRRSAWWATTTRSSRARWRRIERDLWRPDGLLRYRADTFYGGGAWVLLTAGLAWHHARAGRRERAAELLAVAERHRGADGGLPEQVPTEGTDPWFLDYWTRRWGPSASPLLWSHAMVVLAQDDAASAIAVVVQRLGFARDKRRRLPRSVSLATAFSRSTNLQRSLAAIVERTLPEFVDEVERIREVRNAYVAYKLERCYVDYDDLLVMLRALLRQPRLRGSIASRWSHVLVDEYQDVNALQAEITLALAEPHHNVMVVGDPKQSIYAFRGGRFEKIVEFAEHLPGTRIVHLTDNYRSTQAVLDTVNAVMRTMRSSLAEPLVSAVDPGGVAPTLRLMRDEQAAAMHLADTLQEHLDGPASLRDFGVLFRSAYVSLPLQGELVRRKIPFQVFGGRRITELAHVRDVLAYLRLLHDPYDELAWMRVLKLLPGIGEVSAAAMFRDFTDRDALDATGEPGPLERAVKRAGRHGGARSRAAIAALVELLASLPRATSLVEAYDRVLASYEPLLQQRFDDARVRRADLGFFRIVVSSYDDLGGLLADLALDPDLGRKVEAGAPHPGEGIAPVTLSTIHSAKGLEWEHVFVIGVSDGELPSGHALRQSDPEAALAALEEERRLLYVALTRARRNLEVLHAVYGQRGMYELSRFLAEPEVMASFTLVDGTADPTADAEAATGSAAARAVDAASLLAQLRGEDLE
jgi:DNA helicase II / ATP-dependent DNA helicase PcrA